ncbi:MAG: hypothetical protein KGL39_02995 [Patescibacteria group bacterium]|nr:hypothetical protein [Patescibacteria group bacterium]
MNPQIAYAGPGKAYLGTSGFQPDGVNGPVTYAIEEKTTVRAASEAGEMFETLDDQTGKITTVPFDNWLLLPVLFPKYLGVTTAAGTGNGAGALAIGLDPSNPTNAQPAVNTPCGVVGEDGTQFPFLRGFISKHPTLTLLPGSPLYSQIELTALGVNGVYPGQPGFLVPGNTLVESGGVDPDAVGFGVADYGQTHWSLDPAVGWGTVFGAAEGEDGIQIVPDIKYNIVTVQKVSRVVRLASVRFMAKMRLASPNAGSASTLVGKVLGHTSGGVLSQGTLAGGGNPLDLKINGSNGKTIRLVNTDIKGAPFTFGGTKLRFDEIAFVTTVIPQAVPGQLSTYPPSLIFSA